MMPSTREVLSAARNIQRTSGLIAQGAYRRHLHIRPEGQRIWVPESFHGTSASDMNGPRSFVESEVEAATDHFRKLPLLCDVPTDRLMVPDPSRPYFIEDEGNYKIRSGLWPTHLMNEMGLSSKGLFVPENVVVLPNQIGFGLKEIDLSATRNLTIQDKVDEFLAYLNFLVDGIKEVQGASAATKLPPVFSGLQSLANELIQDPALVVLLLDYADLLPIHSKGILYRRFYNILVQRVPCLSDASLPVRGYVPDPSKPLDNARNFALRLIREMPYGAGGPSHELWGIIAQGNVEVYKCMTNVIKMKQNYQEDFVKMMRVGSSHPVEKKMVSFIVQVKQLQNQPTTPSTSSPTAPKTPAGTTVSTNMQARAAACSLPSTPPSCTEVLRLLDDSYPKYPSGAARVFWKNMVYEWLNVRSLFPRMP